MTYIYCTRSGQAAVFSCRLCFLRAFPFISLIVLLFSKGVLQIRHKYKSYNYNVFFFCLFFLNNLSMFKVWKITKGNVTFASAFYDPSSEDFKQYNSMQTRALLNLDKKYCKIFLRAKQLPVKGMIDNSCHALEAVPVRRAIHKLNAYFFLQKIKSECKYFHIMRRYCCVSLN